MPKSSPFLSSVLARFNQFAPVTARAMFGGHGLYVEGVMFALIADEQVYLKADAQNQAFFEEAGSTPFVYDLKNKPVKMSYFLLPKAIYEDFEQLQVWLDSAIEAARRNQAKKKAKPRR